MASRILDHWAVAASQFVKVVPKDLKRAMEAASRARAQGRDEMTAVMAAARS